MDRSSASKNLSRITAAASSLASIDKIMEIVHKYHNRNAKIIFILKIVYNAWDILMTIYGYFSCSFPFIPHDYVISLLVPILFVTKITLQQYDVLYELRIKPLAIADDWN